jgi:(R,R)-butanediol dehydrogenase/meso-butanediol dehydrogenase/diacetyl reductase
MKAAVFLGVGIPLNIETVADPTPGRREIVVRVHRCGICGTDLHLTEPPEADVGSLLNSACAPGSILGHEIGGEVVAIGADVDRLKVGDHVTGMGMAGCGICTACLAGEPIWCSQSRPQMGGYADFARLQDDSCVKMPGTLSMTDCAFIEPLAFAWNSVEASGIRRGQRAIVLGAGPIGLAIAWLARRKGASVTIAAPSSRAESLASAIADFTTIDALRRSARDGDKAADVVFECVGRRGLIEESIELVRPKGTVLVAGLCFTPDTFKPATAIMKAVRLQFVAAYAAADFKQAANILEREDELPRMLVTETISLRDLPIVFEALRTRTHQCKVMVDPSS